jgi:hypothetical protein
MWIFGQRSGCDLTRLSRVSCPAIPLGGVAHCAMPWRLVFGLSAGPLRHTETVEGEPGHLGHLIQCTDTGSEDSLQLVG